MKQYLEKILEWILVGLVVFVTILWFVITYEYVHWDTRRNAAEQEILTMRKNAQKEQELKLSTAEEVFKVYDLEVD